MSIRKLQDARARITGEMRSIISAPGADGNLTAEQETRFDALKVELETTETRIARQTTLDDAERRMAGQTITGSGDNNLDRELRSFSLVRALAGQAGIQGVDAGRERELSAEIARRAGRPFQGMAVPMAIFHQPVEQRGLMVGDNTKGGYLVQTGDGGQFIDILRAKLGVRRLGARVLSGLVGNLEIPRLDASASSGWVGENQALTLSEQSFGATSMSPRHCGALTELSRNMLQQPSQDVEALVRSDFAAILAAAVDIAAVNGSGVGAEPAGILQTSGIGSVVMGTNGGALTADAVRDLIGKVDDANADGESMAFLTNTKVKTSALKLKDGDGNYMGLDTVFAGYPAVFSNNVPHTLTKGTAAAVCSPLIFGNWSDLLLGYWSELDILVNPFESTAYAKGNVQIRAMLTMDTAVRHAASFAAITDLTTA